MAANLDSKAELDEFVSLNKERKYERDNISS